LDLEGDDIVDAVKDLIKGDTADAILKLKDFVSKLPTQLKGCESAEPELEAIVQWGKIFTDKKKLEETVAKNLALHHKKITEDVEEVKADWTAAKYFEAGQAAGDLIVTGIGKVKLPSVEMVGKFPTQQVVNFSVGLLYGFVDEMNLPEIKKCYTTAKPHYAELLDIVHDLQNEETKAAIAMFHQLKAEMVAVKAQCKLIKEDEAALSAWIAQYDTAKKLESTVGLNLVIHHKAIAKDKADA